MKNILPLLISWLFMLSSCSVHTGKMLYEGKFDGMPYRIREVITKNFNGSRTDWKLTYGNLPNIPINITQEWGTPVPLKTAVTTDWGVPYSDAMFGEVPFTYFTEKPAYSSIGDDYKHEDESRHYYSVLYLPIGFSVADYQKLATFMKSEWAAVDKALTTNTSNHFPHLVGLVLAPRGLFIQTFRGVAGGQKMALRIDPDGFVNLGLDDGSAERNHVRHCPVQMPRKAIVLHEIYTWADYKATKAEIQRFRDEDGKSPEAYFKLED